MAAEEEKVLSDSTDPNDIVIIKNLMKVTLGSVCTLKFLDIVTKLIVGLQKLRQLSD